VLGKGENGKISPPGTKKGGSTGGIFRCSSKATKTKGSLPTAGPSLLTLVPGGGGRGRTTVQRKGNVQEQVGKHARTWSTRLGQCPRGEKLSRKVPKFQSCVRRHQGFAGFPDWGRRTWWGAAGELPGQRSGNQSREKRDLPATLEGGRKEGDRREHTSECLDDLIHGLGLR